MSGRLKRLPGHQLFELVLTVAVALGLALSVQAYAVKPYRIPSASMEPTLLVGDRVLVDRLDHRLGSDPHVGDVVVFTPPAGADVQPARCGADHPAAQPCPVATPQRSAQTFVKRVVGVAGDRLSIRGGHVLRNGRRESDGYIAACGGVDGCTFARALTVPAGHVYLMGDNRGNSDDSRFWGPIPTTWVIGQVRARYWPLRRIGTA